MQINNKQLYHFDFVTTGPNWSGPRLPCLGLQEQKEHITVHIFCSNHQRYGVLGCWIIWILVRWTKGEQKCFFFFYIVLKLYSLRGLFLFVWLYLVKKMCSTDISDCIVKSNVEDMTFYTIHFSEIAQRLSVDCCSLCSNYFFFLNDPCWSFNCNTLTLLYCIYRQVTSDLLVSLTPVGPEVMVGMAMMALKAVSTYPVIFYCVK